MQIWRENTYALENSRWEGCDMKKLEVNEREKAEGLPTQVTKILKNIHVCCLGAGAHTWLGKHMLLCKRHTPFVTTK